VLDSAEPPPGLAAFYWHFAQQAKALFIGLFAIGLVVALLDVMIPVFIGKVVTLVTESRPETLLSRPPGRGCSAWQSSCWFCVRPRSPSSIC
jgi:hypothetical protein